MRQEIHVKETNRHRLQNYTKGERGSAAAMEKRLGPRLAEYSAL